MRDGGGDDAVNVLLRAGPAALAALAAQDFGKGADGPQRRPQVVGDAVREVLQVVDRLLQGSGALGHAPLQVLVRLAQLPLALAQSILGLLERILDPLALDGVPDHPHDLPGIGLAFDQVVLDALPHSLQAQSPSFAWPVRTTMGR